VIEKLTAQLTARVALNTAQVHDAVTELVEANASPQSKAAFLTALAVKGESVEEIAAFAHALRERSIQPPMDAELRERVIIDVCGTGGDRLNTFNISTTVAIVVAAAGVAVAKHGNRAITSQAGSADVLEALGVRIDLSPDEAAQWLRERHFAFFFAQNYHPAFKHIAPARKLCAERGQRTIFNFLGPLLNPARPSAQLVGVPRAELCEPIALVLRSLGVRRGMVVSGQVNGVMSASSTAATPTAAYLDELSTLGPNTIAEFYQDRALTLSTLSLTAFPIQGAKISDLAGADCATNAAIVRRVLQRDELGPRRDAILLNASAALFVAGCVRTLSEGWDLAAELIDSGKAKAKLAELARP
jgi:anthranilate phosphoribosyltransferase